MNFSSTIVSHFKRILGWSVAVGLTSVMLVGFTWIIQIREHSKKFILSQVRQTAIANSNSQSMASLDGELNRIISTWSSTEMLPVRVDVYIDGKLWAHGGPLHPFDQTSITDEYTEILPSGEKLFITVQNDIGTPLTKLAYVLSAFFIFFTATFCILFRRIRAATKDVTNPLSSRIEQIERLAADLSDLTKLKFDSKPTNITELNAFDRSLHQLIERILTLESNLGEAHFNKGQVQAAERLSHNLKGIILNFQLTIESGTLSDFDRESLSASLRQLIAIGESVLKAKKQQTYENSASDMDSVFHVGDVVSRLISSRKSELASRPNCRIRYEFLDLSDAIPITKGSSGAFEGAIANLLSNAADAIRDDGRITARLTTIKETICLEIEDNGCGIPKEALSQLAEEGFTLKENGNGLGLFHAKTTIQAMNGTMQINSSSASGTIIILNIPLDTTGIKKEIVIFPGQTFVLVDDDPAIRDFFRRILAQFLDKIEFVYLNSPSEFENWILDHHEIVPGARQYIFDYEFNNSQTTGMDLIRKHGLLFESLVISGAAGRADVIARATDLKIQLMPKDRLKNLRVKWEGVDETYKEMIS